MIHENTFERNSGTKGVIYISSSVTSASEIKGMITSMINLITTVHPIIIGGNSFVENSGYHCSNVLCVQIVNDEMEEEAEDHARCGSKKEIL